LCAIYFFLNVQQLNYGRCRDGSGRLLVGPPIGAHSKTAGDVRRFRVTACNLSKVANCYFSTSVLSVLSLLLVTDRCIVMVAVCNRADHYIFMLFMAALCNRGPLYFCPVISIVYRLSIFFPRLISAATDWISTILLHMAWH